MGICIFASMQRLVPHLFQTNLNTQILVCSIYSSPQLNPGHTGGDLWPPCPHYIIFSSQKLHFCIQCSEEGDYPQIQSLICKGPTTYSILYFRLLNTQGFKSVLKQVADPIKVGGCNTSGVIRPLTPGGRKFWNLILESSLEILFPAFWYQRQH